MTDLAPARRAHSASLASRIGWEVVMQHEVFAVLAFKRINNLLVLARAERRDDQRLRLATGEQRRAMRPRQQADLAIDGPDRSGVAPVDPLVAAQDRTAHDLLFEILEQLEREGALGLVFEEAFRCRLGRVELVAARLLAALAVGGGELRPYSFAQPGLDRRLIGGRLGHSPRLLGAGLGERNDRVDDRLKALMPKSHGAEHGP